MVVFTRVTSLKIRSMVMESSSGLMEEDIKANGIWGSNMALVYSKAKKEESLERESGVKVKGQDG